MKVTCYIAIGSNLGDRRFYIESAIRRVRTLTNTRVTKVSRIIESMPQGGPTQGPYLNAVFAIETELTPYQLLQELQRIENLLGRVRVMVNGPRTVDLDILTYGDIALNEAALSIPHPRMLERDFVMVPLKEIAPDVAEQSLKGKRKKEKGKSESKKSKGKARRQHRSARAEKHRRLKPKKIKQ